MKTVAVFLGYEPYPKQGGMERVTDLLVRMLSVNYKVILICKEKNRLGEEYIAPVPLFFLSRVVTRQQEEFTSILKENGVDILIDQCEGGVIGRYGIFRTRTELLVPRLKCIAVQHNSAMSILNNYYIVKERKGLEWGLGWLYHNVVLPCLKRRAYWLQKVLSADLNKNYDKIVTLSSAFIPHFYKFAPQTPKGKVVAISNPNTYEKISAPTTGEKTVLFVGRLDNKAKGVDRLLRIWNRVEKRSLGWTLKIVGDGQDKQMLMDLAVALKLKRVSFEGFQLPKPYYETASIFCMTSTFEGFGMVLTEAMQHGVVPIAFDSYDALKDIIDNGKDGWMIPPFDEEVYAEKLLQLIEDQESLRQMSASAITSSMRFSREKIAQQWFDLIDKL